MVASGFEGGTGCDMRFDVVRHRQPCQWYNRVGCGISLLAVTAAVTAPLRQAILRPDLPLDACVNSYDHADGALHLAAFEMRAEAIVGVGSILPDPLMDEPLAGAPVYWVIHAMAVHPDRRRLGVGATLLSGLIRHAYQTRQPAGIRLDSLPSAIEFYLRYGFAAAVTRCDSATLPMKLPKIDFHSFLLPR